MTVMLRDLELSDIPRLTGFAPEEWNMALDAVLVEHFGRSYFHARVVAEPDRILAVGQGIAAGDAGWIGNIIVRPDAQKTDARQSSRNLLLTAGHDLDTLQLPLILDVATGAESYRLLRGEVQAPKAGDMMILDGEGIISNILYGPDERTQITEGTRNAVFTVYVPAGITTQAIQHHLEEIQDNVLVIAPEAQVEMLQVLGAD